MLFLKFVLGSFGIDCTSQIMPRILDAESRLGD